MLIGSKVFASSGYSDIEGVIVAGIDIETGNKTTMEGLEIDLDSVVTIRADDDGKDYRCKGWLWSFEAA